MARKCKNLLTSYLELVKNTEPPISYHVWSFMGAIAAALRRQVWLDWGFFVYYPNLYIVLVGPPACKKSTAIRIALKMVESIADIKVSADSITREALSQEFKKAELSIQMPDGTIYTHSSLTIISKELSVFLKSGASNHDLLAILTDLFDCDDKWEYKTKGQGVDTIYGVWLNMLAASTPDWLVSSLPASAIGGGFTSRVIFVVEEEPHQLIPRPQNSIHSQEKILRENIKHDFEQISMLKGEFKLTSEAGLFFDEWYIQKGKSYASYDKRFWGYFERKPGHLLKTAMLISASCGDSLIIDLKQIQTALHLLDQIQPKMFNAFGATGRSALALDINDLIEAIKIVKKISKKDLVKGIWRDVDSRTFQTALQTVKDMGLIEEMFDPVSKQIFFLWKGD